MDLIIASNNQGKIKEIKEILGDKFDSIISLQEANIVIDIEENGSSFLENAIIKAKAIYDITKVATLADDSGLCVDALDGAPGIYSARFSGIHGNDEQNNDKLLYLLENKTNRNAQFVCAVALVCDKGVFTATGTTYGLISKERQGENGFGYDPVFYSTEINKSFGIATSEEKNSISHRSRALHNLYSKL